MDAIESKIIQFIAERPTKVSFRDLQRQFFNYHLGIKDLKKIIVRQIETGRLCYTSHYGGSFIEMSYAQPCRISKHVVIKPPLVSYESTADECVVTIEKGASFGGGEHPTTRLAVGLIDDFLYRMLRGENRKVLHAADIGTGSGILAIVAAKLGIGSITAIDTDPCAIYEARHNVRLNDLQLRITVISAELNALDFECDCIFANLRTPTLLALLNSILQKIRYDGLLILSGIRVDELHDVCAAYRKANFQNIQERSKMGWGAVCLARGSFLDA
jgi:ribosomal protein L11 methyltransferase